MKLETRALFGNKVTRHFNSWGEMMDFIKWNYVALAAVRDVRKVVAAVDTWGDEIGRRIVKSL